MSKHYPESEDDFIRMQQEAIKRVREMQNRARATLERAGMHIENSEDAFPPPQAYPGYVQNPHPTAPPAEPVIHTESDLHTEPVMQTEKVSKPAAVPLNMGGLTLSLDHDQLLLLSMILMLLQDGADKWLLLSLAYVLLA